MICANTSVFAIVIVSNSLTITPSLSRANACAADNSRTFAKSNPAASAFSITKSLPASLMLPPSGVGVVVVTSSFGLTTNLTVIVAANPLPLSTVNVIGNTPPVFVTALNASN